MPFICMIRTDIENGVLQVLDLKPNESQRNLIYDPRGQTKYIRRLDNDTVATTTSGGDDVTSAEYKGLAAYLLDNCESGGLAAGTGALSDSDANDAATAIIALLDAGSDLSLSDINTAIAGVAANTELTNAGGSNSTGSLTDLLKILAGAEFVLPSGSTTESPTGTFETTQSGSFTDGQYLHTRQTGALEISLGEGHLAGFIDSTFEYGGTSGAALVVLDDDGTVMSALA